MKIDRLAAAIFGGLAVIAGGLGATAYSVDKSWDTYHSSVIKMAEDGQFCQTTALTPDGDRHRPCDVFLIDYTGKGYVWYRLLTMSPQGGLTYMKYDLATETVSSNFDGGRISKRCLIGHCRIIREDDAQWSNMRQIMLDADER